MDNAPYHSRRLEPVPTMSSRKQIMQDWLKACGIEFPENALKRELYTLTGLHLEIYPMGGEMSIYEKEGDEAICTCA